MHSVLQSTLTQVREQYCIVKGRQMMKKIVQIVTCRKYKLKLGQQSTAPLPKDRIKESQPFLVTGVDFAGPLYVTPKNNKLYIVLFTCAVTPAVHLELVTDLTFLD